MSRNKRATPVINISRFLSYAYEQGEPKRHKRKQARYENYLSLLVKRTPEATYLVLILLVL